MTRDASLRVTVVDPGFCKPIHAMTTVVDSSTSPVVEDAHHWFVTEKEWMERSGRQRNREAEVARREGTPYGDALKALNENGRRRSCSPETYADYCRAMLDSLDVRSAELVHVARSASRWKQKRQTMRFMSRLCDDMFHRKSTRLKRNTTYSDPPLDETERSELIERLRRRRRERYEMPSIVFFGDASYGPTMRGHNAIPKKAILKELCHKGLTILMDEYGTSKMCPCGHSELKTTSDRFRAHKSGGAGCSLLNRFDTKGCDRDALAAVNMTACSICALRGNARPQHLCRPCEQEPAKRSKQKAS